jgi:acyl-CoA dehydrogenase
MNVQETRSFDSTARNSAADDISEQLLLSSSFMQRTAAVAAVAAKEAADVDRDARFPQAAIDAARQQKLLGAQIPVAFGGSGASIFDIT